MENYSNSDHDIMKINLKCCVIVHQSFAFGLGWKKHSLFLTFKAIDRQGWNPEKTESLPRCYAACSINFLFDWVLFFRLPMTSTSRCRLSREWAKPSLSQDHSQLSNMTLFLNASRLICHSWEKAPNEIWGAKALIWLSNAYSFLRESFFLLFRCLHNRKTKLITQKTQFLFRFSPKKLSIISLRSFSRWLFFISLNENSLQSFMSRAGWEIKSETCGIWIVKVTQKPQFTHILALQHALLTLSHHSKIATDGEWKEEA